MDIFSYVFEVLVQPFTDFSVTGSKALASGLSGTFYALCGVYVLLMGWRFISGQVEEPILDTIKRFMKIAIVGGLAIELTNYNEYFFELFFKGPDYIAGVLSGNSTDTQQLSSLDSVFSQMWEVGEKFWEKGGVFKGNPSMYLVAIFIFLSAVILVGLSCGYILISKVVIIILLALAPIFIMSMLWEATKKYFDTWVSLLVHYGLLYIIIICINVFLIKAYQSVLTSVSSQLADGVKIENIVPLFVLTFLGGWLVIKASQFASHFVGGVSLSDLGVGRGVAGLASRGLHSITGGRSSRTQRVRLVGGGSGGGGSPQPKKVPRRKVSQYTPKPS